MKTTNRLLREKLRGKVKVEEKDDDDDQEAIRQYKDRIRKLLMHSQNRRPEQEIQKEQEEDENEEEYDQDQEHEDQIEEYIRAKQERLEMEHQAPIK